MAAVSIAVEARKPKQAWTSEGEVEAGAAIVVMRIVSQGWCCGGAGSVALVNATGDSPAVGGLLPNHLDPAVLP